MESAYPPWLQAYKHRSSAFSYPTREEKPKPAELSKTDVKIVKQETVDENVVPMTTSNPARDCVFPSMISLSLHDVTTLRTAEDNTPSISNTSAPSHKNFDHDCSEDSRTAGSDSTDPKTGRMEGFDDLEPRKKNRSIKWLLISLFTCGGGSKSKGS